MKKYIVLLVLSITLILNASGQSKLQNYAPQQTYVYRDLGNYNVRYPDGSSIGVRAYILKGANHTGNYPQYANVFTLVGESTSVYGGRYTQTWLYGVRVYMSGTEITYGQYPLGFTAYIKTEPTVVYYWYTNDRDIGEFYFKWESSAYEIK